MSNRVYFVVVMIVGLAILIPLSQYFGGPIFGSGVPMDLVKLDDGGEVEITASMTVDAMGMMRFEWFDAQGQSLNDATFFAMAKPYGPTDTQGNIVTPTFIAYTSTDHQITGIAQRSNPNEIVILLNHTNNKAWPSQAILDAIGLHETEGVEIDVTTEAAAWLGTLRQTHPALIDELVWPSKRELVTPVLESSEAEVTKEHD